MILQIDNLPEGWTVEQLSDGAYIVRHVDGSGAVLIREGRSIAESMFFNFIADMRSQRSSVMAMVPRDIWNHIQRLHLFNTNETLLSEWEELQKKHRQVAKKHIADFDSQVMGIPCGIKVTHFVRGTDRLIHSASEEPNDPMEFEFIVLRASGKENGWLATKITEECEQRIYNEFLELLDEEH